MIQANIPENCQKRIVICKNRIRKAPQFSGPHSSYVTMKHTIIAIALFGASMFGAFADVHVNGYYRSNGTYVAPHWRSDPDGRLDNNYSNGAYNPHKW